MLLSTSQGRAQGEFETINCCVYCRSGQFSASKDFVISPFSKLATNIRCSKNLIIKCARTSCVILESAIVAGWKENEFLRL